MKSSLALPPTSVVARSASPDARTTASTLRVRETVGLAAIFEAHLNAVVLERPADESLRAYARRLALGPPFELKAAVGWGDERGLDPLDELARTLPPDDARDALIEDIAYWTEVAIEITGAPRAGVRLVALRAPMCPGFHVDRVTLRFVCTYHGATSEWLDASAIDLALVTPPRIPPAAIRRGATIESCAPGDVVVLKGSAWPDNALRGVVHRSPPSTEPRLLLTIDPLD